MDKIASSLDQIQYEVFAKLDKLAHIHETGLEDSIENENERLVKQIGRLLSLYRDNLKALETTINRDDDKIVHEVYSTKYLKLKSKYREIQLIVNENENKFIHQQRLAKFGPKEAVLEKDARESLFGGRGAGKPRNAEKQTVGGQILQANVKITNTLQTTKQLLESTILQTELNIDSLDQQSKDMGELNESLFRLSDVLAKSANIVKFIEKQDKEDKRKIYLSIAFFVLCCMWVIWRRLLKIPVLFFLWSFLKLFKVISWVTSKTTSTIKGSDYSLRAGEPAAKIPSISQSTFASLQTHKDIRSSFIETMSDYKITLSATETETSSNTQQSSVDYIKDEL